MWCILLLLAAALGFAADSQRATVIRDAGLYASAGSTAQKLAQVPRGSDLTVLEKSNANNQPWVKVSMAADQAQVSREVTGWLPAQALITAATPDGDQIIFGQAVDSERQAEERGGRKGAARDAMRLYGQVAELFPSSPQAAEAMWRSADIRWQLAKGDLLRSGTPMQETYLQAVITRFPQSKQAELAAYDLLEGKLCSEWRGLAECPQKETALYEQYAKDHPQSPKAPEALYNAAWRQAALTDMYRIDGDPAKSDTARKKATALAQQIGTQYPQSDFKLRALDLIYKLEKKIPVYGPAIE
ncbi:MAG TPA: outer membrane protein assembly factor BamD [Candidatus Angelobacter sp.]|nr:outer membrane protein assembly factor BamD [Candidatus Angelobacter sp.]